MQIKLRLGGVLFLLRSERPRVIELELENFIVETDEAPEITVDLSWDWENAELPWTAPVGEDAILKYYAEEDARFCLVKGGPKGPVACTRYTPDFQSVLCTFNEAPFPFPPQKLGSTLRFLPLREIFLHFGVLFLHASQVVYRDKGVLFTAPSGTGKTTQAKLWQTYRGAEIVCNDRTLLRRVDGLWRTYGYPLDGSEPVRSSAVNTLGAVVLLEQGGVNQARRLGPGRAASLLMGQTVIDGWSAGARTAAMELLLTMMEEIPVYHLTCTPDERAVAALEEKLTEERVIPLE